MGKCLLNSNVTNMTARAAPGQAAVVNYTQQNRDLTDKWLHRLRLTSTNNESRDKLG